MNFQIELTNKCNLACIECPQRMMKRDRQYMSDETFETILTNYIEPIRPTTIILHKDGEPLLHPNIFKFMRQVDSIYTTKFDIYTNGLLIDRFLCDEFKISSRVWVLVSFHFFNYNGRRNDYQRVDNNLTKALEHCKNMNVEFILVTHVTDLTNELMLNEWYQHWLAMSKRFHNLRAVHVNKCINPWTGLIQQKNTIHFDACPYADGNHMFFGVTGNSIACCMDLEEEIQFGNVLTDQVDKIVPKRQAFYDRIVKKELEYAVCKRCLS